MYDNHAGDDKLSMLICVLIVIAILGIIYVGMSSCGIPNGAEAVANAPSVFKAIGNVFRQAFN